MRLKRPREHHVQRDPERCAGDERATRDIVCVAEIPATATNDAVAITATIPARRKSPHPSLVAAGNLSIPAAALSVTLPRRRARTFPRVTQATNKFGELGERIAARWLEHTGWQIVARRFRSGRRDIDLIAQQGDLIAFVEVKARSGDDFGDPVEAVNHRKQRELTKSAQTWIDRHGTAGETYRFDVIGILMKDRRAFVRHVPGAFPVAS
jgi:putative endonuclease